jgi:uncharacterized protein YndB with AHSA1/START domain
MTMVGEYPVSVERLWQAWTDARQLERFWGPPEWPARFLRHDMVPGGRSEYVMTGPDGQTSAGYWLIRHVDEGRSFEVIDGFAGPDGAADPDLPTMQVRVEFEATPTGSRFTSVTTFPSLEAMEELARMGMEQGARSAFGQIDAVLADLVSFAAGRAAEAQLLDDTHVRITRVVRGSAEQVWRAHVEADLVRRWMLGPDGWTMPVCEPATDVGDTYRYEWESADGSARFGFTGELLGAVAPRWSVQTERMIGTEGPSTVNHLTLTPADGGTLVTVVVTYPSRELRDQILATGMVDGMETSYARLDRQLVA